MTFNFLPFLTHRTPSQDVTLNNLRGEATVDEAIRLNAPGRVRFQGSWWSAQCQQNWVLLPGQIVQVVGLDNITLIVEPVSAPVLQFA